MYLSFILLTLSIVLLWLPSRRHVFIINYAWLVAFVLALTVAFYTEQLTWQVLLPLILFGLVCFTFIRLRGLWQLLLGVALVGMSLGFGLHLFPGFHNLLIVDHVQLAADSVAYSLYFNLDKPVIGLFILAWVHPLLRQRSDVMMMLQELFPIAVLTLVVVLMMSFVLGYIRVDVKVPDFLAYWIWTNLFFTCVAEEALFRGFLQRQLTERLSKYRYGAIVALCVCAVLFGIVHVAGGLNYVLLAILAGLGYGWAYQRTKRIEASILLHFLLNTVHLTFFSYPALAK